MSICNYVFQCPITSAGGGTNIYLSIYLLRAKLMFPHSILRQLYSKCIILLADEKTEGYRHYIKYLA